MALVGPKDQPVLGDQPRNGSIDLYCNSADSLRLDSGSVDCIVIDPPYYDNVMYAEISDFFYVWLKRTAGATVSRDPKSPANRQRP